MLIIPVPCWLEQTSLPVLSFQVEDLNAKWQRYDASRDEYVKGLHAQLKRRQVPHEPELMKKEISRLNRQLEEKINDCAEATQELAAVKMARDTALERVQMLEQQVSWGLGRTGRDVGPHHRQWPLSWDSLG